MADELIFQTILCEGCGRNGMRDGEELAWFALDVNVDDMNQDDPPDPECEEIVTPSAPPERCPECRAK
jgi:hypothetical protein